MAKPEKCICPMGPGHDYPNQTLYVIDHRCLLHGEKKLPAVWGRHKDLQLQIKREVYEILTGG